MPPKKMRNKPVPVCAWCDGTGDCRSCGGDGYTTITNSDQWGYILNECGNCKGTGICPECSEGVITDIKDARGGE